MAERDLPRVSVVMPVRNEAAFIRHSLGAVLAQDYPAARLEILVVDGASDDGTTALVHEIAGHDPRVRVLRNPDRIQSQALNVGITAAQGDIIVRVDGRALIAPDYVRQCVRHLQAAGAAAVGGPLRSIGLTSLGRAIAVGYRSPFGVPSRYRISQHAEYVDQVYMGAWPRKIFDQVGGFDPQLAVNEDYEHNYRIRKTGGRVYLTPDIRSAYYGRQTLPALWNQYVRYGRGKLRVVLKYPASTRPRHLVAPLFVAALLVGAVLAPFTRLAACLLRVTVLSYALVNGAASWRESRRVKACPLHWLPAVFAVMHIGWGAGFWLELAAWLCGRVSGKR